MIIYSVCILVFSIIYDFCPDYFHKLLIRKQSNYSVRFPHHIQTYYNLPICKYTSNAIQVTACKLWNNLPDEGIEETLLPLFKLKLKNYLLSFQAK